MFGRGDGRLDRLARVSFASRVLPLSEGRAGAFEIGHGQFGEHNLGYTRMLYRAGLVVRLREDGVRPAETVLRSPDIREHRSVHAQPAWESQHELGRELGAADADQEFDLVTADYRGQAGALTREVTSRHFV
jgi:hypothetical protein